jgi:protein-S-isoprenylcysteine O-methyltransferase Ste14
VIEAKEPMSSMTPEIRKAIVSWIAGAAGGLVAIGAFIFLTAGRFDWLWGWIYLAVMAVGLAAHPVLLLPRNPALLAERSRGIRASGTKTWDRWIVIAATTLLFASILIAALEVRWSGPAHGPLALSLAGLLASILGWVIMLWAMVSNAFSPRASHSDRARAYRLHRGTVSLCAASGIYWSMYCPRHADAARLVVWIAAGALSALLFVVRTALEDRTLRAELPGYAEYAETVPGCCRASGEFLTLRCSMTAASVPALSQMSDTTRRV